MSGHPQRYHGNGELHFITSSCYRRHPLLGTARRRDLFLRVLEQVRRRYRFVVVGYVVMPEHIHLLIGEPQQRTPSTVMQALKIGFARRALAQLRRRRNPAQAALFEEKSTHIWQKRYYDFNVWSRRKLVEKLRYIHRNPVERGLVASPELWRWSSYRAYALGETGLVRINQWEELNLKATARERRVKPIRYHRP
jgi:putative transposase